MRAVAWTLMGLLWLMAAGCRADPRSVEDDFVDTSPLLLRGTTETDASKVQVSFQVWANPGKSALRPRKQDLNEENLLKLLGNDFDRRWMRNGKDKPAANGVSDDGERKTVRILRGLVGNWSVSASEDKLQLPDELPAQYQELVKTWLVRRATCPIQFKWNDLGPYFWPRFIKKGECLRNMTCSWPPGMTCTPGAAKTLQILRWHCRNRKKKGRNRNRKKKTQDNNETSTNGGGGGGGGGGVDQDNRKSARRKKEERLRMFLD